MRFRYIANACFQITLSTGETILTDPWFEGPCQQTWWNFPPPPEALKAEVWAARPDFLYISHLHHDHLHPQTLAPFDRGIPVLIGRMNTPNLRNALAALGFRNLREIPFETDTPLSDRGARLVLFKDFHGNTRGDDSQVEYDLDTSLYLTDADGTRLFCAVDNTILPADGERIASQYGPPDIAQIPYASASLYPMSMADYDDARKLEAMRALRARASANFRDVFRALGAKRAVPAGGEYVLGGPAAGLSRFLPQPLQTELREVLAAIGQPDALAKLYPGDDLDSATLTIRQDPRATHRGFDDAARAAYALTLANMAPSYTALALPADAPFDWLRALKKCAANFAARRTRMKLDLPMDVYLDARDAQGGRGFLFRLSLDSDAGAFVDASAPGDRASLTYELDQRLLFCLINGLVSWNAMEASALMAIRRHPDTYAHDLHRSMVHFTLLS